MRTIIYTNHHSNRNQNYYNQVFKIRVYANKKKLVDGMIVMEE